MAPSDWRSSRHAMAPITTSLWYAARGGEITWQAETELRVSLAGQRPRAHVTFYKCSAAMLRDAIP